MDRLSRKNLRASPQPREKASDELLHDISEALKTLLQRSEKRQEGFWAPGFITDADLIELWGDRYGVSSWAQTTVRLGAMYMDTFRKYSYLEQVSALLGLNETEKEYLRSHFLKSISILIFSGLFKFDLDWKNILSQDNPFGDRSLPVTEHNRENLTFLRLDQLDLFAQQQYAFLPYAIKEMKAAKHGEDVEQAIPRQYRLPFYGTGEFLKFTGTMKITREKIPKGLLVFKDGSTSQKTEFKDVKRFPHVRRLQFVKECSIQSLLKGGVDLHPNIFLCFSYVRITDGPAFIITDPASCDLHELLYGEKKPPADRLWDQPSSMLYDALGVASALKWLHSSIVIEDEVRLECMHMDVNPKNILVFFKEIPGKGWKISEFGMSVSRLTKGSDPESPEPWVITAGRFPEGYGAPEVEYTSDQVGYPNDIWSFGCILMEVFVVLIGGSSKVKELQMMRGGFGRFYETQGEDHSLRVTMRDWLIRIVEKEALPWQRDFQRLIFDILQGQQDRRPSASELHRRLCDIVKIRSGVQYSENVELVSRGIQCDLEIDLPEVTSRDAPSPPKERSTLDLMKIKRWLDSCEEVPEKKERDGTAAILDLYESLELHSRVIDVIRLRVVPAPKRCRYVALSYVWGGRQRWTLRDGNDRFFRNDGTVERRRCSKTIWDAIQLCQNVGERYLWVDALCIVQDTEDKHAQIQAMEAIYRGAIFTIAAAAGGHADTGLMGVSDGSRRLSTIDDQQQPAGPNSFGIAVNSSIWNTRAWTYQERILSRRLLIFATGQMIFQCSHGRAHEMDGDDPHEALNWSRNSQPAQSDTYKLELERNINFNTYAQIIQEYSKRTLSHEEDIENAFGGIKKIISLLFSSEVIFCVPIAALDISLLWYPVTDLLQRRCAARAGDTLQGPFPSWSWAGWVGPVYYRDLVNISERTVSCLRWRQPEDSRVLYASEFGKNTPFWPQHEDWLRQVTPEGRPYYIRRNGNLSHWFCHPITRFIHDPVPIDRDTGQLFFLADKTQSVSWRMDPEASDSNTLRIFHHATGCQLGKVIMQVRYDSAEKYELLKISSTTLTDGEKDPAWNSGKAQFSGNPGDAAWNRVNMDTSSASEWFDPEAYDPSVCFCLYNVLVTVVRGSITYRVGIGKIHIHAFDEVAVRDQLVRLG